MTDTKRLPTTRMLPPFYFLLAIILMAGLNYIAPAYQWLSGPWTKSGYIAIVIGLSIGLAGNLQFKRHKTPVKPFSESSFLVTDGVFNFSRNPMYLGMILMLLGTGVVMGALLPLAVIPMFAWRLHTRFVLYEEMMMEDTFGDAYRKYKRRVRRWI